VGDNVAVITTDVSAQAATPPKRFRLWNAVWIAIALMTAIPIAWNTYERVLEVNRQSRVRLITEHRLWELHPEYQGTPEVWTRFASRLLTDRQLLTRISAKYGPLSEEIERDYRRDVTIAQSEVVLTALALWALPLALVYGLARALYRRPRRSEPPVKVQPASVSDPRYLPRNESSEENRGH
jgi:hypothetical protein